LARTAKATGVLYVETKIPEGNAAKARIVVLPGAGASPRDFVKFNEQIISERPGDSSGKVGHYLMDTSARFGGQIPRWRLSAITMKDGASEMHMYMPWWLYKEQLVIKLIFRAVSHRDRRRS